MSREKALKIVSASAGSGKTYTLVQEYLRIVLNSPYEDKFQRILAMTFTNKAANEMKERIMKALVDLGTPSYEKSDEQKKYLNETAEHQNIGPDLIEQRSAAVLNKILHHFNQFSVMTLDKFTHRVIRTFSRDLKLSMDFDVELDLTALRQQITDMLFDKIGRDKALTRLMLNYANSQLQDDKSWNFNKQLSEFSKELFKENAFKAIEHLSEMKAEDFLEARTDLIAQTKKIENQIATIAKEALDLIESKGLEADDFHGKSNSIVAYFYRVFTGNYKEPSDTLCKNISEGKWGHPKSPNQGAADAIGDLLEKYFHQLNAAVESGEKQIVLNKEILRNVNNLSLLNHLMQIVRDVKEEENVLLISDFYREIAEVIISEPVPFIYERLGVRYEHFLLDEFQDTSRLQWINLVPLLENSLSQGHLNLIVGDGKQAIYRWRNGEVEQFTKLPDELFNPEGVPALDDAAQKFKDEGERSTLEFNYRSSKEIVQFNNELFEHLKEKLPDSLRYIYDRHTQKVKKESQGYIEAVVSKELKDEDQFDFILKSVHKAIEQGYRSKDICVITRKNKRGSEIAEFLAENKLKVLSADSLDLGMDRSVKLMVAVLSCIQQPLDKNRRIKALEHLAVLNFDTTPHALLAEIGEENLYTKTLQTLLKERDIELKTPSSFINLYEFVEDLLQILSVAVKGNPYIQFFLEQTHLYEKRHGASLKGFLEWFESSGKDTAIVYPESADAIRVMTIHKAKGLEFPVVICPFMDWKMEISDQSAWLSGGNNKLPTYFLSMKKQFEGGIHNDAFKEEEGKFLLDNLNLLYVAFTRAERALFISGKVGSTNSPAKLWLKDFFQNSPLFTDAADKKIMGSFEQNEATDKTKQTQEIHPLFDKKVMDKPELSYRQIYSDEDDEFLKRTTFGKNIHWVLSQINQQTDLDKVLEKGKIKGRFDESDKQSIKQEIDKLFSDERFQFFFEDKKTINEKAIIDEKGNKYIPDKIIQHENETLIVDFKTGAQLEAKHKQQVLKYMSLLKQMGYPNVKGELYYTETGESVIV